MIPSLAVIYAEGSTASRTRRYQMGINKYWEEISFLFHVYGLVENQGFQPFHEGKDYKAFVARRKILNLVEETSSYMIPQSKKSEKGSVSGKTAVIHEVKDYGNEPFFVQKAKASRRVVEKYGLPQQLIVAKK